MPQAAAGSVDQLNRYHENKTFDHGARDGHIKNQCHATIVTIALFIEAWVSAGDRVYGCMPGGHHHPGCHQTRCMSAFVLSIESMMSTGGAMGTAHTRAAKASWARISVLSSRVTSWRQISVPSLVITCRHFETSGKHSKPKLLRWQLQISDGSQLKECKSCLDWPFVCGLAGEDNVMAVLTCGPCNHSFEVDHEQGMCSAQVQCGSAWTLATQVHAACKNTAQVALIRCACCRNHAGHRSPGFMTTD